MITPSRYNNVSSLKLTLTSDQAWDLTNFGKIWVKNMDLYQQVSDKVSIPPQLVAAIHMREADCDFTTYLLQGDKLGTRTWANGDSNNGVSLSPDLDGTVLYQAGEWVDAAIFSLNAAREEQEELQITSTSMYLPSLCAYAEMYNGEGYFNKGVPSPYVLAGTNGYVSGKFVADHQYSTTEVDKEVGVLPLLWKAFEFSPPVKAEPAS